MCSLNREAGLTLHNHVVVLGSLNMDLVVRTERLPAPGETVTGGEFYTSAGGKGANQAVAATRLGARVSLIGSVGDDDYGRQLRRLAEDAGVDVGSVQMVDSPTGVALIVVDGRGQNIIAVASGANALTGPAVVDTAASLISGADLLVAQLEVPVEALSAAAERARAGDIPFLLNAAPAGPDIRNLLSLVTVLLVNETELSVLSGHTVAEGQEEEAAKELLGVGPEIVVVTLGARGSLAACSDLVVAVPSFPVRAVDSTGAGDAFVGAFAARYCGVDRLEETMRYASAAGALACTRAGAQPSLPTAEEVENLLSAYGHRV
jgi:ribokinase